MTERGISDENVVFLTAVEARSLQIKARLAGKRLDVQHGSDGDVWCYKYKFKEVMALIQRESIAINRK